MPTTATLTRSLGAVRPRPRTCRGTIMKPAVAAATVVTKSRRDTQERSRSFGAMVSLQLCLGHDCTSSRARQLQSQSFKVKAQMRLSGSPELEVLVDEVL